jgi:hypothetical protein
VGSRGPVPNRSEDLARDRSRKGGETKAVTKGVLKPVFIPEPDPDWHRIARMLWDSLSETGMTEFYQQTDWAFAYSLCDDLSHYKKPYVTKDGFEIHKRSGQMLQTIYSAMSSLGLTEGERRRMGIELDEPASEEDSAAVLAIAEYEAELGTGDTDDPEEDDDDQ